MDWPRAGLISGPIRPSMQARKNVDIDKWGNFGNPEQPAFWIVFLSANGLTLAMLLALLF
jgi:hypothetical protein